MLDGQADQIIPQLTNQPSWPTLRAHLLDLAAETGEHPIIHLQTAAAGRELHTAADIAAVLDWRLPEPAATEPGPLPWLPGIPRALHDHPVWGEYLAKRSELVTDLANRIRGHASQDDTQQVWAPPGSRPNLAIIGEVAVWRAANGIHPNDPRPTGAAQLQTASALWQHHLNRGLASHDIGRHEVRARDGAGSSRDRRPEDRQRLPPTSPRSARARRRPAPACSRAVAQSWRSRRGTGRLQAASAAAANKCRVWLRLINSRAALGRRARVLASSRASPTPCSGVGQRLVCASS